MVMRPSDGLDVALKAWAVPEAKYSCSTYPLAARLVPTPESGSMMWPVVTGPLSVAVAV